MILQKQKNRLKIIAQRKADLIKERETIEVKVRELESEQRKVLKKENQSEIESLGLLLYSNEIQQSLRYLDTLNEKLSREKIEEVNVNSSINTAEALIINMDSQIQNLKELKGRLDYTKVIKKPTPSVRPVAPKKALYVFIAAISSLIMFTTMAFFLDYLDRQRRENKNI